jgi:hypothetical protein
MPSDASKKQHEKATQDQLFAERLRTGRNGPYFFIGAASAARSRGPSTPDWASLQKAWFLAAAQQV